jgi:hypothetical protein
MSDMKQPVDLENLKTGDVIRDPGPKLGYGEAGDDPIRDDGTIKVGYGEAGDDPIPDTGGKTGYGKPSEDPR